MGRFLTSCAALLVGTALTEGATTNSAAAQSTDALRGVIAVSVVVSMNSYETTPAGIDMRMKVLAASALKAAGIRVLDTSRADELLETTRNPVLRLTLLALPVETAGRQAGCAYSLAVQLTEAGVAPTSRAQARVELWSTARVNVTGLAEAAPEIQRDLRELLDQLVSAWRVSNRHS